MKNILDKIISKISKFKFFSNNIPCANTSKIYFDQDNFVFGSCLEQDKQKIIDIVELYAQENNKIISRFEEEKCFPELESDLYWGMGFQLEDKQ